MSKQKSTEEYRKTAGFRFKSWFSGSRDPYIGRVEMQVPKEEKHEETPVKTSEKMERRKKLISEVKQNKRMKVYNHVYRIVCVLFSVFLLIALLKSVSSTPIVGNADNPANNEVSERYIENGLQETGAVNIVTGMILDYRAFDTLGESHVLFIATCTVLILLRKDKKKKLSDTGARAEAECLPEDAPAITDTASDAEISAVEMEEGDDRKLEPKNDSILQVVTKLLFPPIVIFGIYVILCGHLGPGGGFSGGAIIGAGLILYVAAFGFEKTERFFTARTYKIMSLGALGTYAACKSYSFYTGANHIESFIGLGTPGAILSSGLILILNICVGIVVAGTMYTFYAMFRKGDY